MDPEDAFNYNDIRQKARQFEDMLASGDTFFFDTDELEDVIEYYLDTEAYSKAMKAINYGISIFPYESFYPLRKSEILLEKKDFKAAIKILEEMRAREPNNGEIAKLLGDCFNETMQFKRALDYYHIALKEGYDTEDVILQLSRMHFIMGKPTKAISYLNSIPKEIFLDETFIPDVLKLFYDFGYNNKAVEFLEQIIDDEPYNYTAWYFMGYTYQRMEQYEKAITAYDFCIAIDEENTMGYLGKGNCLMDLNRMEEAIEYFNNSLENDISDAEVYCNIAECYEQLNNYSSAKYFYLKALKIDKYLSDAYFGLGVVYKKQDLFRDAERNFLKAIDIDAFECIYHVSLAELYLLMERKERCFHHYARAREIDSETIEIILDYAQAAFEFGEFNMAIDLLKKDYNTGKNDYRLLYRLSAFLFHLGLNDEACRFLHLALGIRPEKYDLLYEFAPFTEQMETVTNIIDLYPSIKR